MAARATADFLGNSDLNRRLPARHAAERMSMQEKSMSDNSNSSAPVHEAPRTGKMPSAMTCPANERPRTILVNWIVMVLGLAAITGLALVLTDHL